MRRIVLRAIFFIVCALFIGKMVSELVEERSESSTFERELLKYINDYRIQNGRRPLIFDEALNKLAEGHSIFMNRNNVLSHSNFNKRFEMSGRNLCVENIGWNCPTPKSQFEAWRNSNAHRAAMLKEEITIAGISKVGPYVTFFACQ